MRQKKAFFCITSVVTDPWRCHCSYSYAGLRCVIIDGFSKGAGYRPGARFHGNAFRNQWTAVSVDDTWRFINCNWGARHVRASRASELVYACDEFYFLTDPEDHIYQHFPDDADWQLLHEPISLDEFTRLPFLKSPFFNNYLAFADRYESTMAAVDGFAEVIYLLSFSFFIYLVFSIFIFF